MPIERKEFKVKTGDLLHHPQAHGRDFHPRQTFNPTRNYSDSTKKYLQKSFHNLTTVSSMLSFLAGGGGGRGANTHQTHEMTVPNEIIGCVIGKGGSKIAEIRCSSKTIKAFLVKTETEYLTNDLADTENSP